MKTAINGRKMHLSLMFSLLVTLIFPETIHSKIIDDPGFKLFAKGNTKIVGKESIFAKPLKNSPIPDVLVKDENGKTQSLAKLVGKRGAIHLWNLNCAPCLAEMGSIAKFATQYEAKFGKFVFLSSDSDKDFAKSEKKLRQLTEGKYTTYFLDMPKQKEVFTETFVPQTIFYNSKKIEQTRGLYLSQKTEDIEPIFKYLKENDK